MDHPIEILSILEKKANIYNFHVYHWITIQSIYTNLPNGNSVVHMKIVNIYLFPKWTELPLSWLHLNSNANGIWGILGTLLHSGFTLTLENGGEWEAFIQSGKSEGIFKFYQKVREFWVNQVKWGQNISQIKNFFYMQSIKIVAVHTYIKKLTPHTEKMSTLRLSE